MKPTAILILLLSTICYYTRAQQHVLRPGFDANEYLQTLSVFEHQQDSIAPDTKIPDPASFGCKRVYRSPEVGLFNRWDLWLRDDKVAIICIRGTINNTVSWMENYFAAMVKANGSIQLNDSTNFVYKLSTDEKADVHAGWLIGMAHLMPTIMQKIDEYSQQGVKDFIVMGHSQGAALAFLTTSYLYYQQKEGKISADIRFKTYCSAAPKPGNLYYAYDYEFITRNGWSFTVNNASDWVPETPFSIQTQASLNPVNPFAGIDGILKKQKLVYRLAGRHMFNQLRKPPAKAQRRFQKYLGDFVYKQVKKTLPQLQKPVFVADNNYMRTGSPITLQPDEAYKKEFPDDPGKIFKHHFLWPYYSMVKRYYVDIPK